ncbi:MAG: prepilin-type N-terminal cleavage/methylation domain-containing protein [Lactobacillaceae bacterium]|jgi:competence protein ComGC|nr:prepilin-type N-terminal cleavage/methylation domain-containing protein [Lactobacillaceae bacterium]
MVKTNQQPKQPQTNKLRRGFTLMEIVTSIFIIGLILLLALPNLKQIKEKADKKQADALVSTVQSQVNMYMFDTGDDSVTVAELTQHGYLTPSQANRMNQIKIGVDSKNIVGYNSKAVVSNPPKNVVGNSSKPIF